MQTINITAEQLGALIADEYRSWLTTEEVHELVNAAVNHKLGVSLEWVNADDEGTVDWAAAGFKDTLLRWKMKT